MEISENRQKWIRLSFINLLIVALLGVVMRYKIQYYLPFIEQKKFLHAHSHFAFSGWATQILMVLMWRLLAKSLPGASVSKYKWIVIANLVAAYGMLFSFPWEGYGVVSIIFSSLSIFVSYVFAIAFWKDLNKIKTALVSAHWFKAALLFNVLSSFGAYFLSYMMANKIQHPDWFLASTYYFLHFQYNGWFFFACAGLFIQWMHETGISFAEEKKVFWLFSLACIPAYFLSALWLPIPLWIYILVVLSALAQSGAWVILLKGLIARKKILAAKISALTRWLFIFSAAALSIKLLLQLGSVIPALSKLAFGFRPVVIGYLHLMFLGVISLFIIGYCKTENVISPGKKGNAGVIIFIGGIILNELLLMIQGLSYMNYLIVPHMNEMLLGAAVIMFVGILLLNIGMRKVSSL